MCIFCIYSSNVFIGYVRRQYLWLHSNSTLDVTTRTLVLSEQIKKWEKHGTFKSRLHYNLRHEMKQGNNFNTIQNGIYFIMIVMKHISLITNRQTNICHFFLVERKLLQFKFFMLQHKIIMENVLGNELRTEYNVLCQKFLAS